MSEEAKADEKTAVKDQEPKYATLKKLFNAFGAGYHPKVDHTTGVEDDGTATHYITGTEGRGRGAKKILLWRGEEADLIAGLFKAIDVKTGVVAGNVDDL